MEKVWICDACASDEHKKDVCLAFDVMSPDKIPETCLANDCPTITPNWQKTDKYQIVEVEKSGDSEFFDLLQALKW